MGFYSNLEQKWYNLVDYISEAGIPLRKVTDFIDKYFPSFILFIIISLIVIALIIYALIPTSNLVTLQFSQDGTNVNSDFTYIAVVNGQEFTGTATGGVSTIKLPISDSIELKSVSLKSLGIKKSTYQYSENINVLLQKVFQKRPVSFYLYDGLSKQLNANATLSFSCSNPDANLSSSDSIISGNGPTLTQSIPENCGDISISASADGYKQTNLTCNSTTCMINFDSIGTLTNDNPNPSYPVGSLRVYVKDNLNNPVNNASVSIYESRDLINEIDISTTSALGYSKTFENLAVGSYLVLVSSPSFAQKSVSVDIREGALSDLNMSLEQSTLGNVSLKFVDNLNAGVGGEFILRTKDGNIVHRGTVDSTGVFSIPLYSYDTYYFDYAVTNPDLMPISGKEVTFSANPAGSYVFTLLKKSSFSVADVKIRVIDQSNLPVKGAKVFVHNDLTGFDDLTRRIRETDSNGYTTVPQLVVGSYSFNAFSGITQGSSASIVVSSSVSGQIPVYDLNIMLYFGYGSLNISAKDEYGAALGFAKASIYKKPGVKIGSKVLGPNGLASETGLQAGSYVYYKLEPQDSDNTIYMPYISEARFIMPNVSWDQNIILKSIDPNSDSKVDYLGVFETPSDSSPVDYISPGSTYYIGYDIYLYQNNSDSVKFDFTVGDQDIVEKEKLFIVDSLTSAKSDIKYRDLDNNYTESDAKRVLSDFGAINRGIYRIYYKIVIRNDSSVKMYDPLKLSWKLNIDSTQLLEGTNDLTVGSRSQCKKDTFCSRVQILDLKNSLYVDSYQNNQFMLIPNRNYRLEFGLINGVDSTDGQIQNGMMQIFNALSNDETFDNVNSNQLSRYKIIVSDINIDGPDRDPRRNAHYNPQGPLYVTDYNFNDYLQNRYIHGTIDFILSSTDSSYINFSITDKDRRRVVTGSNALSILVKPNPQEDLSVTYFPTTLLAPELTQFVKTYVKDSLGSFVKDAKVTFRIRTPGELSYKIYQNCKDLLTDSKGEAECRLDASSLPFGTQVQINVSKDGFNSFYRKDLKPDLYVTDKIIEFTPLTVSSSLVYPTLVQKDYDITLKNNSAVDLQIENIDIQLDEYSLSNQNYLKLESMRSYINETFKEKIVTGQKYDVNGDALTVLKNVFRAALNPDTVNSIDGQLRLAGLVKIVFKTQGSNSISLDIPFNISIVSDGYPTNADNCLSISAEQFNSIDGAQRSPQGLLIPVEFSDTCYVLGDQTYPVKFEDLKVVVEAKSGSISLGQFSNLTINNLSGQNLSTGGMPLGIATSIATNVVTDIDNLDNVKTGNISFVPSSSKSGTTSYTIKLIGLVRTNGQLKIVESKPSEFKVSLVNIDQCIRVYKDSKEITNLTFEKIDSSADQTAQNQLDIVVKNECSNTPIKIRMCVDNSGNRTAGCGQTSGYPLAGLTFKDREAIEGFDLVDQKTLTIIRPTVPGAYSMDMFARLKVGQISYKRIGEIKVNVKTGPLGNSGLYSAWPFLETTTNNGDRNSDVLAIYNTKIGFDSGVSVMNNFENLVAKNESIKDSSNYKDINLTFDFINSGANNPRNNAKILMATGAAFAASSSVIALGLGASTAWVAATAAVTTTTTTLLTSTTTIVAGTALGLSATGIGIVAGAAVALAIGIALLVASIWEGDIHETDNSYVLEPHIATDRVLDLSYQNTSANIDMPADVIKYSGDDRFLMFVHNKGAVGSIGGNGKGYNISAKEFCPPDYDLLKENIVMLNQERAGLNNILEFNKCSYSSNEVKDNLATFNYHCGGSPYDDFKLNTYVLVPCKLKKELWGRSQQDGIASDEYDTGIFRIKVKDIPAEVDYNDCSGEYCYKTYKLNVGNDELGHTTDYYRVAVHSPTINVPQVLTSGFRCVDSVGQVVGYTGPDAAPKVTYDWSLDTISNSNFCTPGQNGDASRYCDSTQFMASNLERIYEATSKLQNNEFGQMSCPKLPKSEGFNKDFVKVVSDDGLLGYTDISVAINDDNTAVLLAMPFKTMLVKQTDTLSINATAASVSFAGGSSNANCNFKVTNSTPNSLGEIEVKPYCTLKIANWSSTLPTSDTVIFKDRISMAVMINNLAPKSLVVDVDLNYKVRNPECIIQTPTTKVVNGKMILFNFYPTATEDKLFDLQSMFHYRAYLMDDGYSPNFISDFKNLCSRFAQNGICTDSAIIKALENGNVKVVNLYDNSTKTNGPGLYNIYNVVNYPGINNLDLSNEDATITIYLEKISSPQFDSVFYYMPFNGSTGVSTDSVRRIGYGVDYYNVNGDSVTLFNTGIDGATTAIGSEGLPLRTLNFDTTYNFSEINKERRGTIFSSRLNNNSVDISFTPDIKANLFSVDMANTRIGADTTLFYNLSLNGQTLDSSLAVLPFFVNESDSTKLDFTGQKLIENYPRISSPATDGALVNAAKIEYPKEQVTTKVSYKINTIVYTNKTSNVTMNVAGLNLETPAPTKTDDKYSGLNSLSDMITQIDSNTLCVGGSATNMNVFVNEQKIVGN